MRGPAIDRNLVMVSLGLMLFGLATLYSAGQTDVPMRVTPSQSVPGGRVIPSKSAT